jgi:ribosome assembly protein 4
MHVDPECTRIATSSKDKTVKIWNVLSKQMLLTFRTHTASVTRVIWGGEGYIYTASQDKLIKMWTENEGRPVKSLKGHGHWVNQLSVSTEYVMRTGNYELFN